MTPSGQCVLRGGEYGECSDNSSGSNRAVQQNNKHWLQIYLNAQTKHLGKQEKSEIHTHITRVKDEERQDKGRV